MATITPKRKTTTEKGLGWRHRQAVERLKRVHQDGSPCDWCGRPMYLDRTRNWDYKPEANNVVSGGLQGDHSGMSRDECLRNGLAVPPPDRLLHQTCNIQRGNGGNDHLAANAREVSESLAMPWPWVA